MSALASVSLMPESAVDFVQGQGQSAERGWREKRPHTQRELTRGQNETRRWTLDSGLLVPWSRSARVSFYVGECRVSVRSFLSSRLEA